MVALTDFDRTHTDVPHDGLPSRGEFTSHYLMDEAQLVNGLCERAVFTGDERRRSAELARQLVHAVREGRETQSGVDAFMKEYALSSEEGVILMCLAEALLRIPDRETADQFISEKIAEGHWDRHLGHSESLLVNASTWGLMLTGHLVKVRETNGNNPWEVLKSLVARSGEPLIRQAIRQAVKLLGDQFVLGRSIRDALTRAAPLEAKGYRFSYDMLGEAARSSRDAERYFDRYMNAIDAIGRAAGPLATYHLDGLTSRPGISVKLSALHARFEPGKEDRLLQELLPRLIELLRAAEARGLAVTIDAEEQDRLEPTLELFGRAFLDPTLSHWPGLGIAVQAYGKRAVPAIRWLRRLSESTGKRIPLRLVKGAYWDSEIKCAQERGLDDYPVLTRKVHTDLSYLACARLVLSSPREFYPQFATHNAHTAASVIVAAGQSPFELQRLHGMGEALYAHLSGKAEVSDGSVPQVPGGGGAIGRPCRIYAPVGEHEELLPYLVRRLLENGANTSFVNRLADDEAPIERLVRDPVEVVEQERAQQATKSALPRPRDIFWPERKNSQGLALVDRQVRADLVNEIQGALDEAPFEVGPIVNGEMIIDGPSAVTLFCPYDTRDRIGIVRPSTPQELETAVASAGAAQRAWDELGGAQRAKILEFAADLIERDHVRLMAVLVREAGKTLPAAHAEIRETVDFIRYYAIEARRVMVGPVMLKGPTGEVSTHELTGRGVFACISPWNFPLAIFVGQVVGALAAGNAVVAKPAPQTPIAAALAVDLLHSAGVPQEVLQLVTGGTSVGAALVRSSGIGGVAFTGSNETAWAIQHALAERRGEIIPFIAETGGVNAMIADSSALPEQVVRDVVSSAFGSAGQRCSAARVLFVQDEIHGPVVRMLTGAIEALELGDPLDYATDVGPVIDETQQDLLEAYKVNMQRSARELVDVMLPDACRPGTFVTPACYEVSGMRDVPTEVFGPILHVVRYGRSELPRVIDEINQAGYGLTLGLHSRISAVADYVTKTARVGNVYINRDQVGAVPGVHPFGGLGLSGTGPKAGGPHYVARFACERTRTTDVTATGGNVRLLMYDVDGD